MDTDFLKQALFSAIRTWAGPTIAVVSRALGITEDVTTEVTVALAVYAIMFVWSIANKWRYEEKIDVALDLPSGASRDTIKDVIKGDA